MFLDASIIVAIAMREAGWETEFKKLRAEEGPFFYSATVRYEAVVAMARIGALSKGVRFSAELFAEAGTVFDNFVLAISATETPITSEIGRGALSAAAIFGKLVGHPAGLNFGDCFSYAAAKSIGGGLLYKGNDFSETDLA